MAGLLLPLSPRSPLALHRTSAALAQGRKPQAQRGRACVPCCRAGRQLGGLDPWLPAESLPRRLRRRLLRAHRKAWGRRCPCCKAAQGGGRAWRDGSEDSDDDDEPSTSGRGAHSNLAGSCAWAAVAAGSAAKRREREEAGEEAAPPAPAQQGPRKAFDRDALVKWAKHKYQFVQDKLNYQDMLPPLGSQQISYTRFLELLHTRRIKRIIMLNEGRVAVVDMVLPDFASEYDEVPTVNRFDETIQYQGREAIEPHMEKFRYYVELPGDIWEDGLVMDAVKRNAYPIIDEEGRVAYGDLRQWDQCTTELSIFDPKQVQFWGSDYLDQLYPVFVLLGLRAAVALGSFIYKLVTRQKKDAMRELADKYGDLQVRQFNTQLESTEETGVRYSDIAGVDDVKARIKEVTDMMLGKSSFLDVGAHPPRGILLEGPPGTGKTLLARAMAGESKLPFFTAVGSEFVEMYQGVAQSRVKNLFILARSFAPSIIFIDEIDALGRARGSGMQDSGSREREQGLLQLLYELDGINQGDGVLLLAATNRANLLDPALLRPGRMDRVIYMGLPPTTARFDILQVHARNKPVPRGPDELYPQGDALLHRTAALTIGYSGAELANLLNEAAILMVRYSLPEITADLIREAMDKRQLGLGRARLPPGEFKAALATVEAARAVVCALTPGIPPIVHVTIQPRGDVTARIAFLPQEVGPQGDSTPRLWAGTPEGPVKVNAVPPAAPLTQYEMLVGLLVPLYAARAAEEVLFGPDRATLRTSEQMAEAGRLAYWLVRRCYIHPARRGSGALQYGSPDPNLCDPLSEAALSGFEELTLSLQRVAYRRAMRIIRERRPVIEQVGRELCSPPEGAPELITGERLVSLLDNTPLARPDPSWGDHGAARGTDAEVFAHTYGTGVRGASAVGETCFGFEAGRSGVACFGRIGEVLGSRIPWRDVQLKEAAYAQAAEVVLGRLDLSDLAAKGLPIEKALELEDRLGDEAERARMAAQRRFYQTPLEGPGAAPFPPAPADEALRIDRGDSLQAWFPPDSGEVSVYEEIPADALFAPAF